MNTVVSREIKKQGVNSKTGKAWTMYAIVTDDGRKASGFEFVNIGDHVALKQEGKYLNYSKPNGEGSDHYPSTSTEWKENERKTLLAHQNSEDGVAETRKHLMQSANLMLLCVKAVQYIADNMPEKADTAEQRQSLVAQLFIEASHKRTNDGINWWSYVDRMPTTPIK